MAVSRVEGDKLVIHVDPLGRNSFFTTFIARRSRLDAIPSIFTLESFLLFFFFFLRRDSVVLSPIAAYPRGDK